MRNSIFPLSPMDGCLCRPMTGGSICTCSMNNSIAIALDQHDKQKEALAACDASLNFTHSPLPDGFDQPVSRTCRGPRGFRVEIQHAIDDRGLRIYRIEQAADVVRSTATSTDGVQKYAFKA